ncbi:hypothetical protein [Persephonella sp.]|uniref:hypothetical protein n=1 Tax=Persephonella sp. TaxID=2060922 RepID=UPI0025D1CE70|nr:hypothetical protein [Persephonella sp.]
MNLDYSKYIKNLLKTSSIEKIYEKIGSDRLNDKHLSKIIYNKSDILLGKFLKNYHLFKRKVYINRDFSAVFKGRTKNYLPVYFFMNKFGYIPNIDEYQRFLLEYYLKYRLKKTVYGIPEKKAIFIEEKVNIPSELLFRLIKTLTDISIPKFKEYIIVPFDQQARRFFQEFDILTFDICLALFNLNRTMVSIHELYKFLKRNSISLSSKYQLLPIHKRLKNISKTVGISIENNSVKISDTEFFDLFNTERSFFVLPEEIFIKDSKLTFQKKISYYLLFLTQVKHLRKDKKPVKISTIFKKSGIDIPHLHKKKGFPYIEEKFHSAVDILGSFVKIHCKGRYKNLEFFLDTKIEIKPTSKYKSLIHTCITEEKTKKKY